MTAANTKKFRQGFFTPKYPVKYVGDIKHIVFRSSWELHMMTFLDNNPNVIRWSSEPCAIPYKKPIIQNGIVVYDKKLHRYFPDFWVEIKKKDGTISREIIEVKPSKETTPSKSRSRIGRIEENLTYAINTSKWSAAADWCHKNGLKFRLLSENSLFK